MNRYLAALIASIAVFLGRTLAAEPSVKPNALEIKILIYSGRPNPVITITDPKEIGEILALTRGMPAHPSLAGNASVRPARLGYRGIVVTNRSEIMPELESVEVHHGDVQLQRKPSETDGAGREMKSSVAAREYRLDGGPALERRLLAIARAKGAIDEATLRYIEQQR